MADVDEDKDGKLTKTEFRLFCEKIKLADPEINVEKIVYILWIRDVDIYQIIF